MKIYLTPKTLKKIIKLLLLFIFGCILIFYANTLNVKAAGTPLDNIRELYFPSDVVFYNINNGLASSVSTSTYLDSYYVSDTEYNVYSYYTPSSISLNSSGYGFGLLVALPFYLSDNVIYSLDLYIGTSSSNPGGFKIPPSRNVDLSTNSNRYNNNNSGGLSYYKSSAYFMSRLFTSSSSTFPYHVYNVSVPFISTSSNSRYIFIPLTTINNYTGALYFFGMNIYINGQLFDTSSLATSTDIELAEDNINSNIDAMQEAIIEQEQQTQDAIDKQTQQDKEQHEETMDTITDSTTPNLAIGDVAGWLPAGTIDSLINLPLTFLTTLNSSLNSACVPYQLPFFNNTTISLPCVGDYLSSNSGFGPLINTIDIFLAVLFLYRLLTSLYKDIQKVLSLKDNDASMGGIE